MGYYQTFKVIVLVIFIASSVGECRLTREKLSEIFENRVAPSHSGSAGGGDQGTKWAVLVAGSNGYGNYRHQADICHAYQILKNGGLKDENIIVMMYDDIAFNEENPRRGIIINSPHGPDVYKGVPKDYTREEVTASNLLGVILGDETAVSGGSRKVVKSSPNDHIFIYYADHGGPGVLTMPTGEDLYAKDLIDTLKKKHASGTYKSMVIYIEACEAGSMFEGMLGEGMNIYVTTASNPDESSWATYCPGFDPSPPKEYETCLGDLYSVAWMEDSDTKNPQKETLEDQYKVVKTRTGKGKEHSSHVIQYGNINLSKDYLSIYMGISFDKGKKHHKFATMLDNQSKWSSLSVVEQHEADLVYLKEKYNRAEEGTEKKEKAKTELEKAISHRMHVDRSIEALGAAVFGGETSAKLLHTVRPSGQPLVDDWDCLKSMVQMYKKYCGNLSSYGKKYMRVFANMCNAGVRPDQMAQASSRVCKMT